jgi:hypothetical protein
MDQLKNDAGNKADGGKVRVDLVDPLLVESAANAMSFGAEKYGENNWRSGISQSRLYGALLRHIFAYWQREDQDPESGHSHLDHAAAMLMMLIRMHKDPFYADKDDRPTKIEIKAGYHQENISKWPVYPVHDPTVIIFPTPMAGIHIETPEKNQKSLMDCQNHTGCQCVGCMHQMSDQE